MLPLTGGTARYPQFAYGWVVSLAAGWIAWVGAVTIAPIEVLAVITYASVYLPWLVTDTVGDFGLLSFPAGYIVASALMLLFTVINLVGMKAFAKSNAALVWFKIAVPTVTVLALLFLAPFDASNFSGGDGFMPTGMQGVLTAISVGGVFFAMFGFDQAIQLGGESLNPRRNIPLSVIGSVLIGATIYLCLQLAFVGALPDNSFAKGWSNLSFANAAGPYAGIALLLGLSWLAITLQVDAAISPGGTGLIYTATSARLVYGLSKNGFVPKIFQRTSSRDVPIVAIVLSFIVGLIVFFPFPSWIKLVGLIVSANALVYAFAPLVFGALRAQEPDRERPFKLPGGSVLAPLGFVAANYIVYFTGWVTNSKLFLLVLLRFVVLGISYAIQPADERPPLEWKTTGWMWPYFGGMALLSYLGSFEGGKKTIPFDLDLDLVAGFSVIIYLLAMRIRLDSDRARMDIDATQEEEGVREPTGDGDGSPAGRNDGVAARVKK